MMLKKIFVFVVVTAITLAVVFYLPIQSNEAIEPFSVTNTFLVNDPIEHPNTIAVLNEKGEIEYLPIGGDD